MSTRVEESPYGSGYRVRSISTAMLISNLAFVPYYSRRRAHANKYDVGEEKNILSDSPAPEDALTSIPTGNVIERVIKTVERIEERRVDAVNRQIEAFRLNVEAEERSDKREFELSMKHISKQNRI